MNRLVWAASAAAISSALFASGAWAGNGAPSGAHYNLNIIGVEKEKTAPMTGSNRHTIFVPLVSQGKGQFSKPNFDETGTGVQTEIVDSQIWLVPGESFQVCDGNGFDLAFGCPDTVFDDTWNTIVYNDQGEALPAINVRKEGAVFQLPCNLNLNESNWDSDGDGVIEDTDAAIDEVVHCNMAVDEFGQEIALDEELHDVVPTMAYEVWARALGKPGGNAVVTTCATVQGELQCSLENALFQRTGGKQLFAEVTDQLTSLVIGYCQDDIVVVNGTSLCVVDDSVAPEDYVAGDVDWTRIALFAGNTEDWFWNYDNNGLRLAQLRFYEIASE